MHTSPPPGQFPLPTRPGPLAAALILFLLLAVPARAAETASFEVTSSWDGGYNAALTFANGGSADVTNWTAALHSANAISAAWNATLGGGNGVYTLTPAPWTTTIPAGGSISIGYTAEGTPQPRPR